MIFAALFVTTVVGYTLKVLTARWLGPDMLGAFVISYALMAMLGNLADLGVRQSLVCTASRCLGKQDVGRAQGLWTWSVFLKVGAAAVLSGLLWALAGPVATLGFGKPALIPLIRLAAAGVLAWACWDCLEATLQMFQKFGTSALLRMGVDGCRLAVFLLLAHSSSLTLAGYLPWYFLMPLLGIPFGLFLVRKRLVVAASRGLPMVMDLLRVGRWVFFQRNAWLWLTCLDSLMLGRYSSNLAPVGFYEAAKGLAFACMLVAEALGVVLLPRLAAFTTSQAFIRFLKRLFVALAGLVLVSPLIVAVAPWFLGLFGPRFADPQVVRILQVLLPGAICAIPSSVAAVILLVRGRASLSAGIQTGMLLLAVALCPHTIPAYGPLGAAATASLVQCLGALCYMAATLQTVRSIPPEVKPTNGKSVPAPVASEPLVTVG